MNETIDIQKKSSRRKYIITAGLVFLLLVVTLVFSMFQSEPKPDPASEEEIRWIASTRLSVEMEVNKKPSELSNEDFAKIKILDIRRRELKDIKILEEFTGLKRLYLEEISYPQQNIPKWMKVLEKTGIYDIEKRFKLDLRPIEELKNLEMLQIRYTRIKNIKSLKNLVNLKQLNIRGCENIKDEQIEDLQKALPELRIYR